DVSLQIKKPEQKCSGFLVSAVLIFMRYAFFCLNTPPNFLSISKCRLYYLAFKSEIPYELAPRAIE
ncbi:hypothetical protein, partial [Vibrio lentus]|uniref:hypothetical protein n=1 Tax=Vibrio lentus TaxID=136468 RepID=UPI001A7E07D8